jgi:ParB family chromosome partitioning protein
MRDLFHSDDGGWLQDAALLDQLVGEKLKATAEGIATEGWKWIEVAVSFPYDATRGLRELQGEPLDLTPEELATIDALNAEYQKLEAEYEDADELPDEVDQRLGEIETARATFDSRPVRYEPEDIARAGVLISIAHDGSLDIDRGYVRPEDEAPVGTEGNNNDEADGQAGNPDVPTVQRAVITIGGQPTEAEDDEDDAIKPLPDRLVSELTAERTLALRDKLANDPSTAFVAVLHKFCLDVFSRYSAHGTAMELYVRGTVFSAQAPSLKDTLDPLERAGLRSRYGGQSHLIES